MRRETLLSELQQLSSDLKHAAEDIDKAIGTASKAGMESLLLHADSVFNTYAPKVVEFCAKSRAESGAQARAFVAGRASRAQVEQERHRKYNVKSKRGKIDATEKEQ